MCITWCGTTRTRGCVVRWSTTRWTLFCRTRRRSAAAPSPRSPLQDLKVAGPRCVRAPCPCICFVPGTKSLLDKHDTSSRVICVRSAGPAAERGSRAFFSALRVKKTHTTSYMWGATTHIQQTKKATRGTVWPPEACPSTALERRRRLPTHPKCTQSSAQGTRRGDRGRRGQPSVHGNRRLATTKQQHFHQLCWARGRPGFTWRAARGTRTHLGRPIRSRSGARSSRRRT